jgi:UDP-N-acetylglucosamine--N-acetylmuramyl-(pentapeptide) pyrophosphoryl-undecaprenol N-acetylglucosamine transferase
MPALALAEDLASRGYEVELVIDHRALKFQALFGDIPYHVLKSATLGKGLSGKITGAFNLGRGILQAFRLLYKLQPAAVIGFGGYPSFPAVYAAQKKGILTILHEQNAVLGKANKMLAPKAERIALSWPDQGSLNENDAVRAVETGNPVRGDIASLFTAPYPSIKDDQALSIFVVGGSLGAGVFSKVVPKALLLLPDYQRKRLNIIQQCREEDMQTVRQAYHDAGIHAQLAAFFEDVPGILKQTHLVITRSGASTVAELSAAGRPAIYVPYPHHADHQQLHNAEAIADQGGGWVMTEESFTPESLLPRIEMFLQNPQSLFEAAEAARAAGKPDAARRLGNLVTALVSGWGK